MKEEKKLKDEMFKYFSVMECKDCPDKDRCPYFKKETDSTGPIYCPLELAIYYAFMEALENEYKTTEIVRDTARILIGDILMMYRAQRRIKTKGLIEDMFVKDKEGNVVKLKHENLVKAGMHLDKSRILRFFKELKLTPKEKLPSESKRIVEFRKILVKRLEKIIKDEKGEEKKIIEVSQDVQ
ncbi:MAG: hypothetical protein ACTSXO_01115 [Candidatus Heimdallarchaeota archaeon]